MLDWWSSLGGLGQVFATIAIPATLILVVQTIMLLFSVGGANDAELADFSDGDAGFDMNGDGMIDADGSHDGDIHGDAAAGLRIFTIRGLVTFFSIFGWVGLLLLRYEVNGGISLLIALVCGIVAMVLVAMAFAAFLKLQSSGNSDIKWAVGTSGSVYMTIPAKRQGKGKVTAVVGEKYTEFDAVTDDEQPIATESSVTVVGVTGGNTLVVIRK